MNRNMKALAALVVAAALAACGGGGGSAGTTPGTGTEQPGSGTDNPGTGGGGTQTPVAASMIFEVSKPSLNNSGGDSTVLSVTALDANNNPVSGLPLSVAVDSGVFTPGVSTTGADGRANGTITIGGNKTNRNITANIRLGSLTATAVVPVTGGRITVSPVPGTPAPGQSVRLDVTVVDSTGAAVPNTDVVFSGTLGLTGTQRTDLNGNATLTLGAAPATAGTYTVDVSALGIQASRSIQVVSPTGGGIPDAVGPVSSASLSVVPNTISPNTSGSTTNRASVRAKFINASNQSVQNVRVRFEIEEPALGAGEQISTGTATVFSDVNGEAIADYIAGTRSSPTNGVKIRACYGLTDADIANGACANVVRGTLTVASQPLAITLGDNNELQKGASNLTYIKRFDVAVADAAGNAVANAVVSASVDITSYLKGLAFDGAKTACLNEDTNRNGFLDAGEDINGSTRLEPRKADVILSFNGSNTTGANGRMQIQVEYPQNVATWLQYTVRVTTNVAGSEGTDAKSYITTFVVGDEENGSFLVPPYGSGACNVPN